MQVKSIEEKTNTFKKPVAKVVLAYKARKIFNQKLLEDVKCEDLGGKAVQGKIRSGSASQSGSRASGTLEWELWSEQKLPEVTIGYSAWTDAKTKLIPLALTVPIKR